MPRVLVIPDIHLKSEIFNRAEKILDGGKADFAIQLGDIFDDWDMQFAIAFYQKAAQRAIAFQKKFPNTLWCMGNHDFGYYYPEYGRRETGHSKLMEQEMDKLLQEMKSAGIQQEIAHVVNKVIFSHAGIMHDWIKRQKSLTPNYPADGFVGIGDMLKLAEIASNDELWREDSPIWARPQDNEQLRTWWPERYMQVVGHTPIKGIAFENNLLSTDVFSTYPNGAPIGDSRFVIVDTEKQSWHCVKE